MQTVGPPRHRAIPPRHRSIPRVAPRRIPPSGESIFPVGIDNPLGIAYADGITLDIEPRITLGIAYLNFLFLIFFSNFELFDSLISQETFLTLITLNFRSNWARGQTSQ